MIPLNYPNYKFRYDDRIISLSVNPLPEFCLIHTEEGFDINVESKIGAYNSNSCFNIKLRKHNHSIPLLYNNLLTKCSYQTKNSFAKYTKNYSFYKTRSYTKNKMTHHLIMHKLQHLLQKTILLVNSIIELKFHQARMEGQRLLLME